MCALVKHYLLKSVLLLYLFIYFILFFEIGFCPVAQVGLELITMLFLQPPKSWDYHQHNQLRAVLMSYTLPPVPPAGRLALFGRACSSVSAP